MLALALTLPAAAQVDAGRCIGAALEYRTDTGWTPRPGTAGPFDWRWRPQGGMGYFIIPLDYVL